MWQVLVINQTGYQTLGMPWYDAIDLPRLMKENNLTNIERDEKD